MSEKEDGKLPIPMEFKHIQLPASIPVDACQGSSLEDAVRDAFDFSKMTGIRVNLNVNGVELLVSRCEHRGDLDTAETEYKRVLKIYLKQHRRPRHTDLVILGNDEKIVKK